MISKYLEINSSNNDQQISIHHTTTSKYCIALSNDHQILCRIIAIQWMISKYCASSLNWSANISLDDPPLYYLIIRWSANITSQHCTMAQALKKFGIKDFAKMMTLAPIFSSQNYFRWKYLDVISFAVSLSTYIWVRVENSLLQQLNCQRISCNSNRLRKGCE